MQCAADRSVSMDGVVVIGEGEKDDAPMLFNGERVGDGTGAEVDVAVDPIDGTTLTAKGMTNAIAVIAVAERGAMFDPSAVFYMEKLVVGADSADAIDITAPIEWNLQQVAKAKGERVADFTVCILDRPRHDDWSKRFARLVRGSSSSSMAMWPGPSWLPDKARVWTCSPASAEPPRGSSLPAP